MMRLGTGILALAAILLAGCARSGTSSESANLPANLPANGDIDGPPPVAPEAPTPPEPGTPGGLSDDRTPLNEPKGPIDPKSAEAAGQVVQSYAALMEQGRVAEAAKLWGDAAQAANFAKSLPPGTHFQVGKPSDPEGAAGSSYVTVPVVIYGTGFSRRADMVLHRVNDVDGSTEAQRRWHIEQVEDVKS